MTSDRSRWIVITVFGSAAAITLILFLVHFHLLGFGVYGDGLGYFAPLRSVFFDRDLVVSNEYEYFAATTSRFGGGSRWPHDIPQYSKYTVGMALVLSPFYLLGHLTTLSLNLLHISRASPHGLSWPYELLYCLGSLTIGMVGLVFSYKACRLYCDRASSAIATLGVWFASPLFFYLAIENSMSHAVTQGLISAFLYYCLIGVWLHKRNHALLVGCLLGLAALVRPQEILFCSVPVVMLLWSRRIVSWKSAIISLLIIGVPVVAFASIQAAVYMIEYGTVSGSPYMIEGQAGGGGGSFNWSTPRLAQVLLSGHRGLFVWHPITLLGTIGLFVCFLRRSKMASVALFIALALQIYLVAAWHCWWQGASVGSRMLSNCTLIFALGLACLWSHFRDRLSLAPAFLTLFLIVWNALMIAQYMSGMIPTEEPVSAATLITNQSKVLPYFWRHIQKKEDKEAQQSGSSVRGDPRR